MATLEVAERSIAAPPKPAGALTQQLLHGPIAPTLLRLAAPNVVVIVVQAVGQRRRGDVRGLAGRRGAGRRRRSCFR